MSQTYGVLLTDKVMESLMILVLLPCLRTSSAQQLRILRFSSSLSHVIDITSEIASGCEEEIELQASSVYAAEKIRELYPHNNWKECMLYCLSINSTSNY